MKSHIPMHEPDLPFGYPGRNYDDTPEHFDHRDDREPPPVDPPEESVVHYGPGDRPLCGNESPFAVYTDEPDQVAGCEDCLELVAEDLQDPDTRTGDIASTAAGRSPPPAPSSGDAWYADRARIADERDGDEPVIHNQRATISISTSRAIRYSCVRLPLTLLQ